MPETTRGFEFGRWSVRPLGPGDGAPLHSLLQVSRPWLLGQTPMASEITTPEEAEFVARACLADVLLERNYVFGAFGPAGELVASCGCWRIDGPGSDTAEIGGWMRRFVRDRAFSTRLGAHWVDHAFRTWGLRRLVASCDADNRLGIALARRLGMRDEGVRRSMWRPLRQRRIDVHVLSLLDSDERLRLPSTR